MSKKKFNLEFELFCNEETEFGPKEEPDDPDQCAWRCTDDHTVVTGYGETIRQAFTDYMDDAYDTINDPFPAENNAGMSYLKMVKWLKETFTS